MEDCVALKAYKVSLKLPQTVVSFDIITCDTAKFENSIRLKINLFIISIRLIII
jgi:hypothetical protein